MFMLARISTDKPRRKMQVMPSDAGAIDATPNRKILSLAWIDSDGGVRSDSYDIPLTATDAELNALVAETGNLSNASLWKATITTEFFIGQPSIANALDVTNDSVKDNVVILLKDLTNQTLDYFIPANSEANTMVAGTENPNPALLVDLVTAIQAVFTGFVPVSYRFTQRRKKNRAVKA